jgi:hypothetical protein
MKPKPLSVPSSQLPYRVTHLPHAYAKINQKIREINFLFKNMLPYIRQADEEEGGPTHVQFVVASIHHAFLEQNKQFLWAK